MKRDMELVRKLLFLGEADGKDDKLCEEYGRKVVAGHVAILLDAKLIEGEVVRNEVGIPVASVILRLTWAGHEFLDNARNDTVWNKVTTTIKNAATTASFEVLVEMLKAGVMAAIQKLGRRMNYWKLGCNWGRGMPDFYSLLKEKRIVICGDSPMAKGDWVLICQGYDAVALAKIGSVPAPSTARADLQADFERLQITYDESNSVVSGRVSDPIEYDGLNELLF